MSITRRFPTCKIVLILALAFLAWCSTSQVALAAPLSSSPKSTSTVTVTKLRTVTVTSTRKASTTSSISRSTSTIKSTLVSTVTVTSHRTSSTTLASSTTTKTALPSPTLSTTTTTPTSTPLPPPPPAISAKKLVAYYASWSQYAPRNYFPQDMPVELLTHVNYAFANIAGGKIAVGDQWGDVDRVFTLTDPATAKPVAFQGAIGVLNDPRSPVRRRNPGLRSLISIGGWSWSASFSSATRTTAARATLVQSIMDFIVQYKFDGVDIDWEYPGTEGGPGTVANPADPGYYAQLLADLRAALTVLAARTGRAEPYLLTVATGASQEVYSKYDMTAFAKYVDWVNIMTYDYEGSWSSVTGPHASIPDTLSTIDGYIAKGLSPSKIALGVPFYARAFAQVKFNPTNPGAAGVPYGSIPAGTVESGNVEYDDLKSRIMPHYQTSVDPAGAGVPSYWSVADGIWMSGEDAASAKRKGQAIVARQLAGAFWWEQSMDKNGDLVRGIRAGMGLQ
ncbi:glycoside hydrolase superfamily [Blastocladiella britannica]|nr:glycoside hydrolase superfamily [Blastocladiella britannica]